MLNAVEAEDIARDAARRATTVANPYVPPTFSAFTWTPLTTYALFMTAVRALMPASVTEVDRGVCSNGTDHVFSFRAGSTTGMRVVLVTGQHAHEKVGMASALRFFVWFATSSDGLARWFRARLQIEFIPCANPAGYLISRTNANGVDPNRNYSHWWGNAATGSASYPQTSAALGAYKGTAGSWGTGSTTNGSPTVTSATATWHLGQPISGSGIPAKTYVSAISGTTLTLSNNATATASGVALTTPGFSEPEPLIVKAVIDAGRTACVIDCHDLGGTDTGGAGGTSDELIFASSSCWHLSHKRLAYSAAEHWHQMFNQDGSLSSRDLFSGTGDTGLPTLPNWASWYLLHSKERPNGAAVAVEAPGDSASSTASTTTALAIQRYASYIIAYLWRWMQEGQQAPPTYPVKTYARRDTDTAALTASNAAIVWDGGIFPNNGATTTLDTVKFVTPYPGITEIEGNGYVFEATAGDRVDSSIELNGGELLPYSVDSVSIPATADGRAHIGPLYTMSTLRVDAETIHSVRMLAKRGSGAGSPVVRRARINFDHGPDTSVQAVPRPNP